MTPRTDSDRCSPAVLDDVLKTQQVRLIDVFLLGPACLLAAAELPKRRPLLRAFFIVAGVGTIVYNARNYVAVERAIAADASGEMRRTAWRLVP